MQVNYDMMQFTTTTTQRNQVTIPAEVRRLLGIRPRDKVAFTIDEEGQVRISAAAFTLDTAYGSVTPKSDDRDLDDIIRDAKAEKARITAQELSE